VRSRSSQTPVRSCARCRNWHQGPGVGRPGKHLVAQDQGRFEILNDLEVYSGRKTFFLVRPRAASKSLRLITIFSAFAACHEGGGRCGRALQQRAPGLSDAVALPPVGRGRTGPSTRGSDPDRLAGLVGGETRSNSANAAAAGRD